MTILVCNKCNLPVIHPNLSGLHYFSKGFCQCQPERSKREDSSICDEARKEMKQFLESTFDKRMEYTHQKRIEEMRCSELYGDIERPAEKIWPAYITFE
jgi:hypothetical protein